MNVRAETEEREMLSIPVVCCKNSPGLGSSTENTFWHGECSVSGQLLGNGA